MESILYLQQFRTPDLDRIILAVSAIGSTGAYLVILSLIYWLVDRRRGWALALVFLLFMQGNAIVKEMTVQPRPYQADQRVELVGPPPLSHAFPSGHAQSAAMLFGGLAILYPGLISTLFWGGLAVAIGLTRMYLGVHDFPDVLAGWAFGGLGLAMMAALFRLQAQKEDLLQGWDVRSFWAGLGLGLVLWHPSAGSLMAGLGLAAAALLEGVERKIIGFSDPKGPFSQFARAIVGLLPLLLLIPFYGHLGPEPALWLRVQFVLLGSVWMFLGGPFLFKAMKI